MKLYPYSKIKTKNLGGLLIVSRVLGVLSYLLAISAICIGFYLTFAGPGGTTELGNGATMTIQRNSGPALMISVWGVVSSICILVFSGLCAAVVSCENKFTTVVE
ncbi:hypothetical protein [Brumicola pallidula]|jgi:hypothetical protein|uniref:Uncharacterized protein n=1 Tax=Brumicola pallidula DSM 14239 = ACAM 615 TaxID=1121922 RepID=K6YW35_9ALTE|nr:hypothetical protein [Glaciecola pallidula]GAC28211.1 hypothetical protein GPAL_1338 [Glaciecola pallidula DSM 14239 = ACAM 615]